MFGYKVNINSICEDSYRSEEEYGEWGATYSNSFDGVHKSTDKHPDVVSVEDLGTGTMAYVVWLDYSTGDSFGSGTRNCTDTPAIFSNIEDATKLASMIRTQSESGTVNYVFTASTGQVFSIYASWSGYFETLENVYVASAIIGTGSLRY